MSIEQLQARIEELEREKQHALAAANASPAMARANQLHGAIEELQRMLESASGEVDHGLRKNGHAPGTQESNAGEASLAQ